MRSKQTYMGSWSMDAYIILFHSSDVVVGLLLNESGLIKGSRYGGSPGLVAIALNRIIWSTEFRGTLK